jgi:hypothetical protein
MPEHVTNELLYEVLKKLQAGQAEMTATLSDVVAQLSVVAGLSVRDAMRSAPRVVEYRP